MTESWDDDILLMEANIPGASLDGKHPTELNVTQLKRWLSYRGAPVSGKKPELIEWYVRSCMMGICQFVIYFP